MRQPARPDLWEARAGEPPWPTRQRSAALRAMARTALAGYAQCSTDNLWQSAEPTRLAWCGGAVWRAGQRRRPRVMPRCERQGTSSEVGSARHAPCTP